MPTAADATILVVTTIDSYNSIVSENKTRNTRYGV